MYSKITLFALFCLAAVNATAGGKAQNAVPVWVRSLTSEFPQEEYIARLGSGKTKEQAQTAALGAVSQYFSTEVESRSGVYQSWAEINGEETEAQHVDKSVYVESRAELFAVHYTDPWYNEAETLWETAAYINRAEAWKILKPDLDQQAAEFSQLCDSIDNETEPIKKAFLCAAALEKADTLETTLDFAAVLYPQGIPSYTDARTLLAEIPQKLKNAADSSPLYIICDKDLNGTLKSSLTGVFGNMGIPVQETQGGAVYVCRVEVQENKQNLDSGEFYTPNITITIADGKRTLLSWSAGLPRTGASKSDIARQRMYKALADKIQSSLTGEMK